MNRTLAITRRTPTRSTTIVVTAIVSVILVVAAVVPTIFTTAVAVGGVTPAAAGDDAVAVSFEPDSIAVEPGDTVEVGVVLRSEGGHDGEGLYRAKVRVDYPADYVEVTDLDVGPWFHQEGEATLTVAAWVDDEAGVARVDQRMHDPGMGVTGTDRIATVTLSVSEDAEPATVELDATKSEFFYAITDFPVPVFGTPAELDVSGGGERVRPTVDDDYDIEESESAETLDISVSDGEKPTEPTDDSVADDRDPGADDGADPDATVADDDDSDATDAVMDSPAHEIAPDRSVLAFLGVGALVLILAKVLYSRR